LVIWVLLRPDPLRLAASNPPDDGQSESGVETQLRSWNPAVIAGASVMVITQLVMVAIMTMTPVYMQHNNHSLDAAGFVIAIHVASMYLLSPISGALVDRHGPATVAVLAAITLVAAGATASLAPPHSITALAVALALLGLGWSLGLISGTTTITNNTPLATRAKTQGTIDLCIASPAQAVDFSPASLSQGPVTQP
jgi:MFS family permease